MKKLILAICLLLSLSTFAQNEKYYSYQRYHTEANYMEQFTDTCKIILQKNSINQLVYISGNNVKEYIILNIEGIERVNLVGLKTVAHTFIERNVPAILEFVYDNGSLIQIIITRLNSISTFIVYPVKRFI